MILIEVEKYRGMIRILFPPGRRRSVFCLPTHRMKSLVTSSVFSYPARIIEIDAGGSVGSQISIVENWGKNIGDMDRTDSRRRRFRKWDRVDGSFNLNELKGQTNLRGIKNPVVRYIYIVRSALPNSRYKFVDEVKQGVYMLWGYNHHYKDRVVGLDKVSEWEPKHFEGHYTFDLLAASGPDIMLEDEHLDVAVLQAHNDQYLYKIVRPALLNVHSEPSVYRRVDYPEAPKVITEVIPIAKWSPQRP